VVLNPNRLFEVFRVFLNFLEDIATFQKTLFRLSYNSKFYKEGK
jgi:hypothetical protein